MKNAFDITMRAFDVIAITAGRMALFTGVALSLVFSVCWVLDAADDYRRGRAIRKASK